MFLDMYKYLNLFVPFFSRGQNRSLCTLLISFDIQLSLQLAIIPAKAVAAVHQWLLGHSYCCNKAGRNIFFSLTYACGKITVYLIFLLLVIQVAYNMKN